MDNFIVSPVITTHERAHEVLGENWLEQQVEAIRIATRGKASLHPARMSPAFGWVTHRWYRKLKKVPQIRGHP